MRHPLTCEVLATRSAERPFALDATARRTLETRIGEALLRARRDRARTVASICVPVPASLDLSAAVLAARRAEDRFFCLEQPGHDGHAICGLGSAAVVEARGPERFRVLASACRELGLRTFADHPATDPARPPGAGPVHLGGFAFAPDGGLEPRMDGVLPGLLVLPELSFARLGGEARLTVTVAVDGDESEVALLEQAMKRVGELEPAAMPLLDPYPLKRRGRRCRPALPLRGGRTRSRAADPLGRARQARARPRGSGPTRRPRSIRHPCSTRSGPLRRVLLLLRGRAGGRVHRRKPGAAGAPRRRSRTDGGSGRHHPPQRRPGCRRHLGEQLSCRALRTARSSRSSPGASGAPLTR